VAFWKLYVGAVRPSGPVTWAALLTGVENAGFDIDGALRAASTPGVELWPQMACRPIVTQVTMRNPIMFYSLPSFAAVLALEGLDRMRVYRDMAWRNRARPEAEGRWSERWSKIHVKETTVHGALVDGPSMAELGAQRGVSAFDVMIDLALEDELATRFELRASNDDEAEIAELLQDPRTLLGLSDAGAHVRELCDACYSSHLLGHWVREKGALSLEQAVWRLTSHPAQVFRLVGKGALTPGMDADVVVFDPDRVGAAPPQRVHDLPGGADRITIDSIGIRDVFVNGVCCRREEKDLEIRSGRLLRTFAS